MWQAVEALPHGFDPTDRLLLHHGSLLADAYDAWFKRWNTAQNVRLPHPYRNLCKHSVLITCPLLKASHNTWLLMHAMRHVGYRLCEAARS